MLVNGTKLYHLQEIPRQLTMTTTYKSDFDRSFDAHESDFNRSFDFFDGQANGKHGSNSDPWSDKTWTKSQIFEFSVASSNHPGDEAEEEEPVVMFPKDAFAPTDKDEGGMKCVQIAIHEQMTTLYNDFDEPSCRIEGFVHVKPTSNVNTPFLLVLKDPRGYLENINGRDEICHEKLESGENGESERVLEVSPPSNTELLDTPIANYVCKSGLRPVPLLVKSRVHASHSSIRVGFKLRANPTNSQSMTRITIVLAVPPHVHGETVKMSRKGGVWDDMKRTLSWAIDALDPGEALEIQAQFEIVDDRDLVRVPNFPALVRCEYPALFSSLQLDENCNESLETPLRLKLNKSTRILHRKV